MGAGALAGAVAKTAVAPLERVKILQQVAAVWPGAETAPGPHAPWPRLLVHVARVSSVRALWRGNLLNVLRVGCAAGVRLAFFGAFDSIRPQLAARPLARTRADAHSHALAHTPAAPNPSSSRAAAFGKRSALGAAASLLASAVTYPLDFARMRWTVAAPGAGGASAAATLRAVVDREGARAFFKGAGPALLGVLPYNALHYAAYGSLREAVAEAGVAPAAGSGAAVAVSMACGASAGAFALTLTFPLDVLNKRLMIREHGLPRAAAGPAALAATVRAMWAASGPRAFFAGLGASYAKVVCGTAIHWAIVERVV